MFGFLKKGLYREMERYCDAIQLATYLKFKSELMEAHGQEVSSRLAAAVANRLFAKPLADAHRYLSTVDVVRISSSFVTQESHSELFLGILLSLRTAAAIATDNNDAESLQNIRDTIEWMKSMTSLPPDAPNPKIMRQLAVTLPDRYRKKTSDA